MSINLYHRQRLRPHFVPVLFPPEVVPAMWYLNSQEVREASGVAKKNPYVFASTKKSLSYSNGWHYIDYILRFLHMKGLINATSNMHRVASIIGKLQLQEAEKDLIFKHSRHSKKNQWNQISNDTRFTAVKDDLGPLKKHLQQNYIWYKTWNSS